MARTDSTARTPRKLEHYRKRRRFDRTPEPAGRALPEKGAALRYVIQKHAARRLHYDFRLEHEGVLLSWSVPKGPSLSPAERRLAVRTEDHPLEYAGFEGVIPQGEYGAGNVMVWDHGSWQPESDVAASLKKGRLTFTLQGTKLHGRWHLVRLRSQGEKRENWLLFKGRDAAASDDEDVLEAQPESVVSGRSLDEIGAARERVWHSNREADAPKGVRARVARRAADRAPVRASEIVSRLPVGFRFTNLDKRLYPELGLTKADLIAYYALVAEWLLPHVAGRPLTLVRCPDGVGSQCFYQKHAGTGMPKAVERIDIAEEDGEVKPYLAIHDLPGLLAAPQLGALELHTWVAHWPEVERPDQLVFDVDPDEGLGWEQVVSAATELKQRLEDLGLESFVKTTGGKGLHVVAPVRRGRSWDVHKAFAFGVVQAMEREHPRRYTTNARKVQRKGRLFLDYLRNGRGATAVAPYSTRARPGATVATPLTWSELEHGVDPKEFTIYSVPKRLASLKRDPWGGYAALRQSIGAAALRKLGVSFG
jgi:bifunctional non-homologous end joining protein LigD